MKTFKFNHRGTEINKIQFSEIEMYLEEKGINVHDAFDLMADEKEFVYVSNGFVRCLFNENEIGEWHHFFVKENGFEALKLKFN